FFGDTFQVPDPADPSGTASLSTVGDRIARRLSGLVVRDEHGRRAVSANNDYFQTDPHWRDLVPFHEYFDGDTGRGLGAAHQTGWTAMIALLLQFRGALRFDARGEQSRRQRGTGLQPDSSRSRCARNR